MTWWRQWQAIVPPASASWYGGGSMPGSADEVPVPGELASSRPPSPPHAPPPSSSQWPALRTHPGVASLGTSGGRPAPPAALRPARLPRPYGSPAPPVRRAPWPARGSVARVPLSDLTLGAGGPTPSSVLPAEADGDERTCPASYQARFRQALAFFPPAVRQCAFLPPGAFLDTLRAFCAMPTLVFLAGMPADGRIQALLLRVVRAWCVEFASHMPMLAGTPGGLDAPPPHSPSLSPISPSSSRLPPSPP